MPDWYTRLSEITRYEQMEKCLKEQTQVPVIAPRDYFLENRDRLWYFKTDTHWNEAGGFVAGQIHIDSLGRQAVAVDGVVIPFDYLGPCVLALFFLIPYLFPSDFFFHVHRLYS